MQFKKQLAQVFYKSDKLPCINKETDQTSQDPQAQANVFVVGPVPSGGTQSGKTSIGGKDNSRFISTVIYRLQLLMFSKQRTIIIN